MIQTAVRDASEKRRRLEAFTAELQELLTAGQLPPVEAAVERFVSAAPEGDLHALLAEGLLLHVKGSFEDALIRFYRAQEAMSPEDYPPFNDIFTSAFVQSQFNAPRRRRPAVEKGYHFFKNNLAALQEVDAELADLVQKAPWPVGYALVELWEALHLSIPEQNQVFLIEPEIARQLPQHLGSRRPIGLGGIGTGQELRMCLSRQVDIIYGMTRPHFLFEPDLSCIRALLHLFDVSEFLRNRELFIFGGELIDRRVDEVFGSFRYEKPEVLLGNPAFVEEHCHARIAALADQLSLDAVDAYYKSPEFAERLEKIAAGEIMPRVLVDTCRWTTFLKYCAADFEKAYRKLGCETRFLIEENDVQTTLPALHWKILHEFKPDFMFMVSHARPTLPFIPRGLPFIGFIQDKCGPIQKNADLAEHIMPHDLFVCMMGEFRQYLIDKNVPAPQAHVMPIPADEDMFFPLPPDHPDAAAYTVDVSCVKHGYREPERLFPEFLRDHVDPITNVELRDALRNIFVDLYDLVCRDADRCYYEPELVDYVLTRLGGNPDESSRNRLINIVQTFHIIAYSCVWRGRFFEALDEAKIPLALYGNKWDEHARLKHLSRGPVQRDGALNSVYNFSRVNLSILHVGTMHQRLAECGLAGGFLMVADHNPTYDWESARNHYDEDREIVFFSSRKELVEKCRYYLDHPQERREIAERMHQRASRERTCLEAARRTLKLWSELYQNRETNR